MSVSIAFKPKILPLTSIDFFNKAFGNWFNHVGSVENEEQNISSSSSDSKKDDAAEVLKGDGVLKFLQSKKEEAERLKAERKLP